MSRVGAGARVALCEWRLAAAGSPAGRGDTYPDTHSDANGDTNTDGDADPHAIVMSRKRPGVQLDLCERRLAAAGSPTGDVVAHADTYAYAHADGHAHADPDTHAVVVYR